jgi:hypothetical protein
MARRMQELMSQPLPSLDSMMIDSAASAASDDDEEPLLLLPGESPTSSAAAAGGGVGGVAASPEGEAADGFFMTSVPGSVLHPQQKLLVCDGAAQLLTCFSFVLVSC